MEEFQVVTEINKHTQNCVSINYLHCKSPQNYSLRGGEGEDPRRGLVYVLVAKDSRPGLMDTYAVSSGSEWAC